MTAQGIFEILPVEYSPQLSATKNQQMTINTSHKKILYYISNLLSAIVARWLSYHLSAIAAVAQPVCLFVDQLIICRKLTEQHLSGTWESGRGRGYPPRISPLSATHFVSTHCKRLSSQGSVLTSKR